MATVTVEGTDLVISVKGMDRLWALKSQLTIPIAHVRGITADPGIVHEPKGRRWPGAHIPRVVVAGTFVQDGEKIFWDVRDTSRAVVIELHDEEYQRLVVQVADPRETVRLVEEALPPQASAS
jgi:hypothetical protein